MTLDRERLARAFAAFAMIAPVAYLAQRVFETVSAHAPADPALVLHDPHTALYWRAALATWWGGLAGALAYASSSERLDPFVRRLAVPLLILLSLIAWRFP